MADDLLLRGYYTPLDRDYYVNPVTGLSNYSEKPLEKPLLSTAEIGTTIGGPNPFRQTLQAAIRTGVSKIEIAPSAEQRPGSSIDTLPYKQRKELKEMADAAKVEIVSTHTPAQIVGNLSGLGERGFSEYTRAEQLNEVKKTIEFAADVSHGGAIVLHLGEYPRPLFEKKWGGEKELFEMYPKEKEEAVYYIVDKTNGQVLKGVRGDEKLYFPEYEKDEKGNIKYVETIDPKTNKIIEMTHPITGKKIPKIKRLPDETLAFQPGVTFEEFFEKGDPITGQKFKTREEAALQFFKYQQEIQINQALGQAAAYEVNYEQALLLRNKILNALQYWQEKEKTMSETELLRFMQIAPVDRSDLLPPDIKKPTEYLTKLLHENEKHLQYGQQTSIAARAQAEEAFRRLEKDIVPICVYAEEKTAQSMAEAALYAVEVTKKKQKEDPSFKPLFIAPENMFPEMGYGSHPQELKEIVLKARKKFKELLIQQHVTANEQEAERLAEQHIKATIDTEHLGMWRRRFKLKEGETQAQADERFKKWYLEQLADLAKSGIVGHIHMADGLGRGHANLPPGGGMLPIKEAMEYFKEIGFSGTFISEGYGDPERQITDAWTYFGSPIYAAQRGASVATFASIYGAHAGRGYSPYFVLHSYVPINELKPWTETPFE